MQERIALAIASLVLVVGAVASAVGVGDDEEAPLAVATTAPATLSPIASPSPVASATPAPSVQATAMPAATVAPAGGLPAATPPKPGSYRYRETSGGETTEETLRITDKGAGRQTEEDGEVTSEVAWRDDGKYILETTFTGQGGFRCDWDPDVLEYRLPLASGSTWRVQNSCTVGQGFSVEIDATSTVTGSERTTVAGQTIDTWVIHSEGTLTFRSPQGSSREKVSSDDRFSPAHGLSVRLNETVSGPDPATGENVTESSTRELLNLTPA